MGKSEIGGLCGWVLTRWQRLLELLNLLGILQDESVDVFLAADLEI